MKRPEVSVIIPTKDRIRETETCLAALHRSVKSSRLAVEVIVVDDGSRDGTQETVRKISRLWGKSAPLRLIRFANSRGPAAARNAGASASRAPLIAYLDSDCIPQYDWLGTLVRDLKNTGFTALECRTLPSTPPPFGPWDFVVKNKGKVSGFTLNILRRKAVMEVGGFDERFNRPYHREDTDLLFKLVENGAKVGVSTALMLHPVRRFGPGRFIREGRNGIHEALLFFRHPRLYFTRLKWIDGLFFPAYYLGFYAGAGWLLGALSGFIPMNRAALAGAGGLTLASLLATIYVRLRNRKIKPALLLLLAIESLIAPFIRLFWVLAGFGRATLILASGRLNSDRKRKLSANRQDASKTSPWPTS